MKLRTIRQHVFQMNGRNRSLRRRLLRIECAEREAADQIRSQK